MTALETGVQIIDFKQEHQHVFKSLNEEWISQYFELEERDLQMINDPQSYILDEGGYIFMAKHDDKIVGTCALIKIDELTFELAKMAVSPSMQGKGIGFALGKACIDLAKSTAMRKFELLSNTILTPAINLYKKLGFYEVKLPHTDYKRANIKMELDIQALVKATVIVADDLPAGFAINAASLVTASLGNKLKHLIGNDVTDASTIKHCGLTWLPISILKADRSALQELRSTALNCKLMIVDIPEQAQVTRKYEDFSDLIMNTNYENIQYLALGIYGDKKQVADITKKISLYK